MNSTYWLSFAGEEGFRGIVLVDCPTMADAHRLINQHGVNLGGEIAGFRFEGDDPRLEAEERARFAALPRLTPLSRAQVEAMGVAGQSLAEARAAGQSDVDAVEAACDAIWEDGNPVTEGKG
jgi:hypothetical protein